MKNCFFCKIANKEASARIVYENEKVIAFTDIKPVAPVHILIIPKKHIPSIDRLNKKDKGLIGELSLAAQKLARKYGIDKTGYRLVFNTGKDAGQTVEHLHLHLIGGKRLPFA